MPVMNATAAVIAHYMGTAKPASLRLHLLACSVLQQGTFEKENALLIVSPWCARQFYRHDLLISSTDIGWWWKLGEHDTDKTPVVVWLFRVADHLGVILPLHHSFSGIGNNWTSMMKTHWKAQGIPAEAALDFITRHGSAALRDNAPQSARRRRLYSDGYYSVEGRKKKIAVHALVKVSPAPTWRPGVPRAQH